MVSVQKRLPWLIVLLGLGLIVSSVVGLFEGVVAQLPLIICFQSLILDMAGNVGTQSLAVTIGFSPMKPFRLETGCGWYPGKCGWDCVTASCWGYCPSA